MVFDQIIGSERLVARFGVWPSFHDAEVVRFVLDREGANGPTGEMTVHVWVMTGTVDSRGYYVLEKHTLVRFLFEQITSCQFSDFNQQSVLFDLEIKAEAVDGEAAFSVVLDSSYGLDGSFVCGRIVIADVTPCDEKGQIPVKV